MWVRQRRRLKERQRRREKILFKAIETKVKKIEAESSREEGERNWKRSERKKNAPEMCILMSQRYRTPTTYLTSERKS